MFPNCPNSELIWNELKGLLSVRSQIIFCYDEDGLIQLKDPIPGFYEEDTVADLLEYVVPAEWLAPNYYFGEIIINLKKRRITITQMLPISRLISSTVYRLGSDKP
jgi:hypothetical protein